MKEKRAVVLKVDDWEALYIDGRVEHQGHSVCEGDDLYYLRVAEKHNLTSDDFLIRWMDDDPKCNEYLDSYGEFPLELSHLPSDKDIYA